MNIVKPKTLSLEGDWEDIVNNAERHNARVRFEEKLFEKQLKKDEKKLIALAFGAILSVGLCVAGFVAPWLGVSVAAILVCAACFKAGQTWAKRGACR